MKWIEITRWIGAALIVLAQVLTFIEFIKVKKNNPQDHVQSKILLMMMWIQSVGFLVFMEKMSIVVIL